MKIKEAKEITGGLSNPSKMPGKAYSIPASRCHVGSRLAKLQSKTMNAKLVGYAGILKLQMSLILNIKRN